MRRRLFLFLTVSILSICQLTAQKERDNKVFRQKTINVDGIDVDVQAELLDSGKITLFRFLDFYLEIPTDTLPVIIKLSSHNQDYITQLSKHMADCPVLTRLIHKTKFNSKGLTKIVRLYNNCSSLTKKELYSPTVSATLGAGLSFIQGSFEASEASSFQKLNCSFKRAPTYYFSISLTPPRKKNFSIGVEAFLSSRSLTGYASKSQSETIGYEKFLTADYSQFTTSFQFVHYITRAERIRPFYSVGLGVSIAGNLQASQFEVYSNNGFSFVNQTPSEIKLANRPQMSLAVGVKTLIGKKLAAQFELRLDVLRNQILIGEFSKSSIYYLTPTLKFGLR